MRKLFFLVLVATTLFACESGPFKGFETTEGGLYYKMHTTVEDTLKPSVGDLVSLQIVYTDQNDSIFSSSTDAEPMEFLVREPQYSADFFNGLMMLSIGDSASFMIHTDSFFMKTVGQPTIPPYLDSNSYFRVDVRMDTIITADQLFEMQEKARAELIAQEGQLMQMALAAGLVKGEANEKGIYIETLKEGRGAQVESGKYALFNLKFGVVGSEPVMNTFGTNDPQPFFVGMGQQLGLGFESVIADLKVGGHVRAMVPSELAFGERGSRGIDPYSPLLFEIEVVDVMTEEELTTYFRNKEGKDRDAFIKQEGITGGADENGIYIVKLQQGTGITPQVGKEVHVHYTGMFMDGRVFDSSLQHGQPFSFMLGQGNVIPGWDKIVAKMKVGDKWKVVIPSEMGYGERGFQGIPPFTTLVFEMELVDAQE
jgi:peptidylprolyl isomerase